MADAMDLTGEIAAGVDGALERGHAIAIGYVDDDDYPVVTFRGSTQVHSTTQLAFWARKLDDGIVAAIADRPQVSLLFHETDGPGPLYLSFRGRARVDPAANDKVYAAMIEAERARDPERKGVAVIVDVESVHGFASGKVFSMET